MDLLANLVSQNLLITVHSKVTFDNMQVFLLGFLVHTLMAYTEYTYGAP